MGYSNVAAIGSATTTSSVNTLALNPTSNIVVDKVVFFCAATYNDATAIVSGPTNRHTSVADNTATPNTWNKLGEWTQTSGAGNDGTTLSFWWTKVRTQINTTDTITLTIGTAVGRLVISAVVADISAGSIPLVQQVDWKLQQITATVSNLPSQEYLLIGFGAAKYADSSKTPDADYAELSDLSVGTFGNAISTHVQYRIATLTADICTSTTWTTSQSLFTLWAIVETYASVSASVSPSPSAPFYTTLLGSTTNRKDYYTGENSLSLVRYIGLATGSMTKVEIGVSGAGNVRVALYADSAGDPGGLINSISSTAVVAGNNIIDFPTTAITSGTYYWLTFVTDTADILLNDDVGTARYGNFPYATSFPDPAGSWTLTQTVGYSILGLGLSAGGSASLSPSTSVSPSLSPSTSLSPSSSVSSSVSPSLSQSSSVSPSVSPSQSRSVSPSVSQSRSISPSISSSASQSASISPSRSVSSSISPSFSVSPSVSPSVSKSISASISASLSPSFSISASQSVSPSVSPSISPSGSLSPSSSPSAGIYGGILKRWNGSTWVKEPLKVYLGSWQTKILKVYLAGTWQEVDISGV